MEQRSTAAQRGVVSYGALAAIADAIRAKTGSTAPMSLAEMPGSIAAISNGGSGEVMEARVTGTLTDYSDEQVKKVGDYGLAYLTKLRSVSLPACTTLGVAAFPGCTVLTELHLPALVSMGYFALRNCSSLTSFVSSSVFNSRIDQSTFDGCSSLRVIDLQHIDSNGIAYSAFGCANLETLIIRNTDYVAPLKVSTAFGAATTKMNQGLGYIYVPRVMVASYQAATNWVLYADQIRAIEDYPEITGG